MWQKLVMFPLLAQLTVANFVEELKNDERGLSGVVVAVLLILVAVLAIVVFHEGLAEWLETLWKRITNAGDSIS